MIVATGELVEPVGRPEYVPELFSPSGLVRSQGPWRHILTLALCNHLR